MQASAALIISFPETTTAADRDLLVAELADAGLLAIEEDDVTAPARWVAHFPDRAARDAVAGALRAHPRFSSLRLDPTDLEDDDWARRTQADLPAVRVGRIIVAPPWDAPTPEAAGSDTIVLIEPSRGFGTGHHQSTRLCLALLQQRDLEGRTAIDVGTGSGVLAITAARLGAARVSAIDVDPDAVENARENVERNRVSRIVDVHEDDLAVTTMHPADVVTANLTGSLIERYAASLARLVKPGGVLLVAGFTIDECDRVRAALVPAMVVSESAEEEGWWAFALVPQHG